MPARKMRIELFDSDGDKYTISFEGQVTREKAVRLLDLVELLGGMPEDRQTSDFNPSLNNLSKYDKMLLVIQENFPVGWFTSKEVQNIYEQNIQQPISLSTVSTYLSRMTDRGILNKIKSSNYLKYRLTRNTPKHSVKRKIP